MMDFWADGFSVDDGELFRSDDPRNAEILDGIRQGRAPPGTLLRRRRGAFNHLAWRIITTKCAGSAGEM
jgi:hypothetical protein